jgi:hypothetical protein
VDRLLHGWLPGFGVLAPASDHPLRRNAAMLGAHFAWGWATAEAMRELGDAREPSSPPGPSPTEPGDDRAADRLAASAAAPSGLAGVWQGEIGNLPVRACFTEREWGAFGAYFYQSRLQLIALEAAEGGNNAFTESEAGAGAPRWQIERVAAGS